MNDLLLLDTNVLLSKTLRDWFFLLAADPESGFDVIVSQAILDEFSYHVRRQRPYMHDGVRAQWLQQISHSCATEPIADFPITAVEDYPDVNDLHVHSAAVWAGVSALISSDEKLVAFGNLPTSNLSYQTFTPDDYLFRLTQSGLWTCIERAYLLQEKYLLTKYGSADLVGSLLSAGSPQFARALENHFRL